MGLRKRFLEWLPALLSRAQSEAADAVDLHEAYRLILGREADRDGFSHWKARIDKGMTRDQLIATFLASQEFRRKYRMRELATVQLDGYVLFVDSKDHAVSGAVMDKCYEPHVTAVLERELRPDSVLVDVGASIGWFALLAAARAPRGKVIAFEPGHDNVQLIYRSVAANGFDNVVVYPFAATDRRRYLQLALSAAYGFVHDVDDRSDDTVVQGVTVDEIVEREPRVDIIKIDIEGHEPFALRGMQQTIARHHPLLLTEFHPKLMRDHAGCDPGEYLGTLFAHGYDLSVVTPEDGEVPHASADEIVDFWKRYNARNGAVDTVHLDLVGRPRGSV